MGRRGPGAIQRKFGLLASWLIRVGDIFEFSATEVFESAAECSDNFFFNFSTAHVLRIYALFDHGEVRVRYVSPVDFRWIKWARFLWFPWFTGIWGWRWNFLILFIPFAGITVLARSRACPARRVKMAAAVLCLAHLDLSLAAFPATGVTFAPSEFFAHPNILNFAITHSSAIAAADQNKDLPMAHLRMPNTIDFDRHAIPVDGAHQVVAHAFQSGGNSGYLACDNWNVHFQLQIIAMTPATTCAEITM